MLCLFFIINILLCKYINTVSFFYYQDEGSDSTMSGEDEVNESELRKEVSKIPFETEVLFGFCEYLLHDFIHLNDICWH